MPPKKTTLKTKPTLSLRPPPLPPPPPPPRPAPAVVKVTTTSNQSPVVLSSEAQAVVRYFQQQYQGLGQRDTSPCANKYERAHLLGVRAVQIGSGTPSTIDAGWEMDPLKIATKEIQAKQIPLAVRRYLPNGSYQDWHVDELVG